MKKVNAISNKKMQSAKKNFNEFQNLVAKRISYIVNFINESFGLKTIQNLTVNINDNDNEMDLRSTSNEFLFEGKLSNMIDVFNGKNYKYKDDLCFYVGSDLVDWSDWPKFPKSWIFCDDFETKFKAGKEKYLKETKKINSKRQKEENLKKAALAKLSMDEKKILGLE